MEGNLERKVYKALKNDYKDSVVQNDEDVDWIVEKLQQDLRFHDYDAQFVDSIVRNFFGLQENRIQNKKKLLEKYIRKIVRKKLSEKRKK